MKFVICKSVISLCAAAIIICVFLLIKNEVTCRQRIKILNAIYKYNLAHIEIVSLKSPLYEAMESYGSTLFRWWDWGCKRIVPRDVYAKIESYL